MITVDTRFSGFDARSWHRLVTLVAPGLGSHPPYAHARRAGERGGMLVVLYHAGRVLRAVHTQRGVVAAEVWPGPEGLEALAQAHGTRFAVAAEAGALEELGERVGGRLHAGDDPWATVLIVAGAVRELVDEGQVHLVPRVSTAVPLPPADVLRRAWDHVLPEGRTAVVALFDRDELDTAVVVRRQGAGLDRVYGPEALRTMVGPLGGDFRRDYRVLRAAVERDLGPVAAGLYTTTAALRGLLQSAVPGAWARAIAARDVVVDPLPPWMAVAAGASALRAAAAQSRRVMAGLELLGLMTPLARRVREIGEMVGEIDLRGVLGFDPLEVLGGLLRRSSSAEHPDEDEGEL